MSGKFVIGLILIGMGFLPGEIIHFSKMEKKKTDFYFKKDLFSPGSPMILETLTPEEKETIRNHLEKEEPAVNPEKEILEGIIFEGFIEKDQKILALITAGNEFFMVSEGDVILDGVKIIRIENDKMVIELGTQRHEIQLKGEGND